MTEAFTFDVNVGKPLREFNYTAAVRVGSFTPCSQAVWRNRLLAAGFRPLRTGIDEDPLRVFDQSIGLDDIPNGGRAMYQSGSLRHSATDRIVVLAEAVERSLPVAAAKVRIPASTSTALERERLHALLDTAVAPTPAGSPVPVVCAPAGAGKTTMLATWVRRWVERGNGCAAWVSLDAEDNDPALLWSAILRALQVSGAWERGRSLELLAPPSDQPYVPFLAAFLAAFERSLRPVVLVLDGIHEVCSEAAVRTLNFLLRHTPPTLRIVLTSRFPPPVNLARLKVEGRLREIDPGALAFTEEEARLLYSSEGIRLTEPELRVLMKRTEGWPAGLRLAALTLDDNVRPAKDITEFTGDEPVVSDYFVEEVLARQPTDVQQFMLATSVSRTFTVSLAAALSGLPNVGQILDWLERSGIVVCDRSRSPSEYHYHPLLGRCLHTESDVLPAIKASLSVRKRDELGRRFESHRISELRRGGIDDALTKEDLYIKAQRVGIPGRSSMNRGELARALLAARTRSVGK